MEKGLWCPQCGAHLPEEAAFCAYCGTRIARPALAVPSPRPPERPLAEVGLYPSGIVYLFSDRFAPPASPFDLVFGERHEETPCKDRTVRRRELARTLLVTAIVYMATERLVSLNRGKRSVLGGIYNRDTIIAVKLSDSAPDPASLEGMLFAGIKEPGGQSLFDLIRAVVGSSGSLIDRFGPYELVTRIVKRYLVQRGLLREAGGRGLAGVTARGRTVGVCEAITPLEPHSEKVGWMLIQYRDLNREIYSGLLDDVSNAIYAISPLF